MNPPARYPSPIVIAEVQGFPEGSYFLPSMYPPNVIVNEPAKAAAMHAILIVDEELTMLLSPAASARGMVIPSISPIQIFMMVCRLFKISEHGFVIFK